MYFLREATAGQEILLGPLYSFSLGTPNTSETIANTDIKIFKAGATAEVNKNSGGATHLADGRYYTVLDASDTDTVGTCEANVYVSGDAPIKTVFTVLPANIYDSFIAGTDKVQADVVQVEGGDATDYFSTLADPTLAVLGSPVAGTLALDIAAVDTAVDSCIVDVADVQTGVDANGIAIDSCISDVVDVQTSVDANGTAVANVQTTVDSNSTAIANVQTRLPSTLVGGRIDSNMGSVVGVVLVGTGVDTDRIRPAE